MPRNSPRDGSSLLIASVSARALAEAARRAGFTPLVADFFADADTQDVAHACRKLTGLARGFRWRSLYPALSALAELAPSPVLGLVYGSGFEDRPELLRLISRRWPLLGTGASAVARLKSPEDFFATLDRLGIAHPPTQSAPPARGGKWLAKKRGGAGGSHIVPSRHARAKADNYFQEHVAGRAVSALFVACGGEARVLGFSEQWTSPLSSRPWRYGGAVCPANLSFSLARNMTATVKKLARAYPIKGLASADFLLCDDVPLLLEINPRPGATLDIFDRGRRPLLSLHIEAAREGKLPSRALALQDAMASAIVYAARRAQAPADGVWPAWVADRPQPSEWIDKSRPICTVSARAGTVAAARRLAEARSRKILQLFQASSTGDAGERHGKKSAAKHRESLDERQRQSGAARQGAHR
ncbi:MAG: ATP-grasp domain-containing protein [Methyloceanibacter sp.]